MKENEKKSLDIEINLVPLLKELLKRAWIIVLVGLVFATAFYVGAKVMIKPTYRSGFTAYVNNAKYKQDNGYLTNSDLMASKELVKTFAEILKSRSILTEAAENLGWNNSYEQLQRMVSTEIQNETEIISVYVVHKDPQRAYDLANEIAKIAPAHMAQVVEGSSMKVIDYPVYSDVRYKPNYSRYAILGFFAGVLIVAVIVIIRYIKDDVIRNEKDIEIKFSLPILGVIPDSNSVGRAKGSGYYYSEYGNKADISVKNIGENKHEK